MLRSDGTQRRVATTAIVPLGFSLKADDKEDQEAVISLFNRLKRVKLNDGRSCDTGTTVPPSVVPEDEGLGTSLLDPTMQTGSGNSRPSARRVLAVLKKRVRKQEIAEQAETTATPQQTTKRKRHELDVGQEVVQKSLAIIHRSMAEQVQDLEKNNAPKRIKRKPRQRIRSDVGSKGSEPGGHLLPKCDGDATS